MISQQRYMGKALKHFAFYLSSIDVIQNKVQFISGLKRVVQSLKCLTKNSLNMTFSSQALINGTAGTKEKALEGKSP